MKLKINKWLLVIFFVTLSFRLFFAFQTPHYSSDNDYYTLRNIDYIKENLKPMTYDELSYGGRPVIESFIFYYLMAIFSWIPLIFKILPAVLISLLVFAVYYLTKEITDSESASLFSAFMASFLPILITGTLNQISVYTILIPLLFFSVYCLININEEKYTGWFIFLSFLLPFLHPIALLFSFGFLLYYLLVITEDMKLSERRKEAIFFFLLLSLFIGFIMYKKVFLETGFNIFLQNVPKDLLVQYFRQANMFDMIISIGILPFLLGISGVFYGVFKEKRHSVLILSSIVFMCIVSLVFMMVRYEVGLMFLGISLAIISSLAIEKLFKYFDKTKFSKHKNLFKYSLFALIALTLVLPSIFAAINVLNNTLSDDEFQALTELRNDTDENSTILTNVDEGNTMMYITNRKSAIDNNFYLIPRINQRYEGLNGVYTTTSSTKALQALHEYNVKYVYVSSRTKDEYNIEKLKYVQENDECFKEIKDMGRTQVFKISC